MKVVTVRGTLPGQPGAHNLYVLAEDTHISRWVAQAGRLDHDQNALPVIEKLLDPEDLVYDVGAFIGDHTAFYAACARKVYAFEPQADAFHCLQQNTRLYRNVVPVNRAVGDGSWASMEEPADEANAGARSLRSSAPSQRGEPTITIDDSAELTGPPDVIKLDVEGFEVAALRGASRVLYTKRPTLVVEVNRSALERAGTSPAELREVIALAGYRVLEDLFTGQPWEAADPRPQFDVVCR